MANETNLAPKERFLKIYANLPLGVRGEIIATIDNIGPVTWNSTYIEIEGNTDLGNKILSELDKLEII